MRIMIADDDLSIRKVVQHIVEDMGGRCITATNGKDAVNVFFDNKPDLVILDVMMPKLDGFDVCGIIRQKSDVPILFLTAKSDIVDKSVGFKMGADDYLTKPFNHTELELRIKALLKRQPAAADKNTDSVLHYKDLTIYFDNYEVYLRGEKVPMTLKEFSILSLLAKHRGQVFTKNQLIDSVWGRDYIGDYNSLTVFIRKIREKIEQNPSEPEYLLTVWGVGYKFNNE